jgi:hypothetical protein
MPHAALMEAAGVPLPEYLRNAVSALRPKLNPLGWRSRRFLGWGT